MASPILLMLEDDADRLGRFQAVLDRRASVEFRHWRTAHDFLAAYKCLDRPPGLICLAHDLFPEHESDPDPGDGRDVARFLVGQPPRCPVLIHSSNASAAYSMFFALLEVGWTVDRIAPPGVDWIEVDWWLAANSMLVSRTNARD